jgi:hypothetical protein
MSASRLRANTLAAGLALSIGLVTALPSLAATEVRGIRFADTAQVGNQSLQLNGAGVRVKVIVDVYAAALYLPKRDANATSAIAQAGAKSVQIVLLRELTGEDFADAMMTGFRKNNSEAEVTRMQARLDQLKATMTSFGTVRKGTSIQLNFVPGAGTRTLVEGQQKGQDIPGEDFYAAVLKIWLGNKPVDGSLKDGLLGNP